MKPTPRWSCESLTDVYGEALEKWPAIAVAIHHRYGVLEIGQAAVVIAVSSPHRKDAFEACQYLIDRLKEVVPIWKKEFGEDDQTWVGMGP